MSKLIKGTTVITYQGDDFKLTFNGLEPGMNIYLGVRDKKYNQPMFDEISETVNEHGEVTFKITSQMSNKLVVKPGEACAVYYYGIKQVDPETEEENTIVLGEEADFEAIYIIKVLAKKAEGN